MNKPHILLAQSYWCSHLKAGDIAFDMTCGNGHDTLFLTEIGSVVFGFDIQAAAIENTRKLAPKATLFQRSHDDLPPLPVPQLIVYNLGYLPGGDKSIVTKTETTLKSIKWALSTGAAVSITCYPGHEEGAREEAEIVAFLKGKAVYHQWLNRPKAPSLLWIAARK